MVLKVAPAASLRWPQQSLPQSPPSCSQTLATAIPSPSSSRRRSFSSGDGSLLRRFVEKSGLFLGANPLRRSRSRGGNKRARKALTASLDSFSDEEFSKQIEELALRFQLNDDDNASTSSKIDEFESRFDNAGADEQWQRGLAGAGGSACCSIKKAFSSMVFIIRELHSYTLQMRSLLHYEDMQGIVAKVQREMHASFVWLFQKVFSTTPTLMVYVMILLANYSVFSMSSNAAIASAPPPMCVSTTEEVSSVSVVEEKGQKFDASIVKTLKLPSSTGKAASVGGSSGGGGGKFPSVASGTEGDGRFDESNYYGTVAPDGSVSSFVNPSRTSGEESVSSVEEEATLWDSLVEEASKMGNEDLDQGTKKGFVSPVDARIEADDDSEYLRMELLYQTELAQEPSNPLLLANYAQFLYLVVRDLDRYVSNLLTLCLDSVSCFLLCD